ncbi:autophagy-related protein [Amanita rubescens]|nr:autophagy-related protein [Amanita rubescens]
MSNSVPTITIDLTLDRATTRDVLHGILHSILFHRLFGTVKPRIFEVLDVTMPGVSDPAMEQLVNEKVEQFWKGIESGFIKRGQISVFFSEKRPKKSWFQVYMGEEEVPWEKWVINVELTQSRNEKERQSFNRELATTLTKSIQVMLTHTVSERGRTAVPLITDAGSISPFPIRMVVKVGGVEVG